MMSTFMQKIITLACLGCFVFLQGCTGIGNPWKDPEAMRQDLLELTPIGSSLADVESKLKRRHIGYEKYLNHGFIRGTDRQLIGVKYLSAQLAGYRSGLLTSTVVTAFWGFDAEDRLIEIWVQKNVDSV